MFIIYTIVPSHQTGDDVACGAIGFVKHDRYNHIHVEVSSSVWLIPGTYSD